MKEPLSITHPEIAAEWHPTLNGNGAAENVGAGSNKAVWWRCSKGPDHEWQAPPCRRTSPKAPTGCPFCAGKQVSATNSLARAHPSLATQWHPTKNEGVTPNDVTAGTNRKFWWVCPAIEVHEWKASVANRVKGQGCPFCSGRRATKDTSLATARPEIAALWHCAMNGSRTPDQFLPNSNIRVWWKCPVAPDHEWEASVYSVTKSTQSGCPFCAGKRVSTTNCLAALFPDVAAEWHPTKNAGVTPKDVVAGSAKKLWWKCPVGPDHEWQTSPNSRSKNGRGCPFCARQRASSTTSITSMRPELAAEWHPTKNGDLTPDKVMPGSGWDIWWRCSRCPEHEWKATPNSRTNKESPSGCPYCAGKRVTETNSLAARFPEIAAQWHYEKNCPLTPDQVIAGSSAEVWWKCPNGYDHEWQVAVKDRTQDNTGCPFCAGKKVSATNSLASRYPDIAAQWHPTKNGSLSPDKIVAGSEKGIWWKCPNGPDHEWQAKVAHRTRLGSGCPYCKCGWTLEAIRSFVSSLIEHLPSFSPAELYLLFQQNGLLATTGKGKAFVKALATGRFPKEEVDKFVIGEPSLVDEFVRDPTQTLEAHGPTDKQSGTEETPLDRADELVNAGEKEGEKELPVVETKDVLGSLGLHVISSADEEAVEFLLASAVAKIWKHAYRDEEAAVAQANAFPADGYAEQVRSRFLDEYRQVKDLAIPPGYAFQINGKPAPPNLMQRHFAIRVRERKRVGNWSGTGAGKTLGGGPRNSRCRQQAHCHLLPKQRRRGLAASDPRNLPG